MQFSRVPAQRVGVLPGLILTGLNKSCAGVWAHWSQRLFWVYPFLQILSKSMFFFSRDSYPQIISYLYSTSLCWQKFTESWNTFSMCSLFSQIRLWGVVPLWNISARQDHLHQLMRRGFLFWQRKFNGFWRFRLSCYELSQFVGVIFSNFSNWYVRGIDQL